MFHGWDAFPARAVHHDIVGASVTKQPPIIRETVPPWAAILLAMYSSFVDRSNCRPSREKPEGHAVFVRAIRLGNRQANRPTSIGIRPIRGTAACAIASLNCEVHYFSLPSILARQSCCRNTQAVSDSP